MRLFAAVLPPAHVTEALGAAVSELRSRPGADRLRWTDPAGWHLTAAFHGEIDDSRVPELRRRLAAVAAVHRPFTLRLSGGGHFGDRALWAGVDGDRDRLAALAADAAEAGRRTLHAALPATHLSAPDAPATGASAADAPAATGRSVSDPPPGRYVPSPGGPEDSVSQGSVSQGGEGRPDVHRSGTAWSFVPHLTLARGPGGVPLTPWAAELDGFASQSWQVTEVALVSSRLPRGPVAGPRYLRVAAWPLGG